MLRETAPKEVSLEAAAEDSANADCSKHYNTTRHYAIAAYTVDANISVECGCKDVMCSPIFH